LQNINVKAETQNMLAMAVKPGMGDSFHFIDVMRSFGTRIGCSNARPRSEGLLQVSCVLRRETNRSVKIYQAVEGRKRGWRILPAALLRNYC